MPKAREHRQKHRASRTESVTGGRAGEGEGEGGITLSPLTPAPVPIAASVLTTETAHLHSDDRQPDVIEVEATVPPPLQDGGPSIPRGIAVLLLVAALAQSFSSGAISLFINKDLAFQPVEATQYWMYVGLTMWSQPLVGWMSDSFTPFGERRRPLFVLSVSCSAFIFMLYAVDTRVTQSHATFVLLSLVNQIFIMGAYIPLNGLLVEVGKKERENSDESGARMAAVMSQAMTIRSVGSFGGSLLQTILLLFISVRGLLGVTSVLHVAVAFIMLSADASLFRLPPASTGGSLAGEGEGEENARGSHEMCEHTKQTCKKVRDSFDIHDIRSDGFSFVLVLLFVFFYNAMPDASVVYYSYLFSEFNFPTWFYSMNGLVGALASTIGAYLFSVWMTHRSKKQLIEALARAGRRSSTDDNEEEEESPSSLRSACSRLSTSIYFVFVVGSGVWALAYLTNLMLCTGFVTDVLHIPAKVFVPVDNFFVSLCVRFAFMPTIIMAAEHAPKHFEATAFEVFSVASMAGGTFSSLVTSAIAHGLGITRDDSSNLYIIIIISVVFKLAPIPVAYYLPQRRQATDGGGGVDTATATAATAATDIAVVTVEDAEEDAHVAASDGNDNGRGERKSGSSSSSRRKKREGKPSSPSSQEVHAALSTHEKKKKKSSRNTGQTAGGGGSTTNDNGDGEDDAVARAGRDERARLL